MHATGRDEAHNRQVQARTFHHQFAEFLGGGHVEGAGLEVQVGDQRAHLLLTVTDLDGTDTGNHTTGFDVFFQRFFDGAAETREGHRVGGHQAGIGFGKVTEETFNNGFGRGFLLAFGVIQYLLNQQVVVSHGQAVPEVFTTTNGYRADAAVVGFAILLGGVVFRQQFFKDKGDHHKQGVGQAREGQFFHSSTDFRKSPRWLLLMK